MMGGRAGIREVILMDQSAEKLARARLNHQVAGAALLDGGAFTSLRERAA